ncbi:MAG: Fic family protein [Cyanobacteria bacterium J06621_12]
MSQTTITERILFDRKAANKTAKKPDFKCYNLYLVCKINGKTNGKMQESISLIEPLMPSVENRQLVNLASELIEAAAGLNQSVHPVLRKELGTLVRSMNCYYSNLIEGHRTLPRDIERALNSDFVDDERARNLQLEALAHIKVQEKIDLGLAQGSAESAARICWLHEEFASFIPASMLQITNKSGDKVIDLVPGEYRSGEVIVGKHIPISAAAIPAFLARFERVYNPERLSKISQIIATAASHHRLLWIHPFYDGNGRVSRLFSHGYLKEIGIGNSLWSVARGLSRNVEDYKKFFLKDTASHIALADSPRWNDLDGRGNLTAKGLIEFCVFFLNVCLDQIKFMSSLIEPEKILTRMEIYTEEQIRLGNLLPNSFLLLKQLWLEGEIPKNRVPQIVGYKERQARTLQNKLIESNLIVADDLRSPLRLNFPIAIAERYFPSLF